MPWPTPEQFLKLFHSLAIPFLGGFALTLGKIIADKRKLAFEETNNIALDLVLIAIGATAEVQIKGGNVTTTTDALVGDLFVLMTSLYFRHLRNLEVESAEAKKEKIKPIGWFRGCLQLAWGMAAIIWTMNAI